MKPLIETYQWLELQELPFWATSQFPVKATADILFARSVIKKVHYDVVFNELVNIKTHLKSVPLLDGKTVFDIWNEQHTSLEERWLKVFADLRKKAVPYMVFAKLVEYALMIPGKFETNFIHRNS